MSEQQLTVPGGPLMLAFLMGGATLAAPHFGAGPAAASTVHPAPHSTHISEGQATTDGLAGYTAFDEPATLRASIDTDIDTGTGTLHVVAPAGRYSIEASLEGEVTFADGSRCAVFTGDQAASPIPLRLTAHQGNAAVGLAAVMPVTGLERWAPDRPRHRAGAMQVVSGAVAVPFH